MSKNCLYLLDDDQKMRDFVSKQADSYTNLSVKTFTKSDALIEAVKSASKKKKNHIFAFIDLSLDGDNDAGFDVLSTLQNSSLERTRLYVISSNKDKTKICKSYELGAHSYFQKPLANRDLETMVGNLMNTFSSYLKVCA